MKKLTCFLLVLCLATSVFAFTGCGSTSYPTLIIEFDPTASSGVGGTVKIELHPEWSPNSVNFVIWLTQNGYYDKVSCFKTIEESFVAFGDAWNIKKIDKIIDGEFPQNGSADSGVSFTKGIVGMWYYDNYYDSCYGSIFMCLNDSWAETMDGMYAPIGKVIEGFDYLIDASHVSSSSGMNYEPYYSIKIKTATVLLHGKTYDLPVTHTRTDYPGTETEY